jgi:hypothetical protein
MLYGNNISSLGFALALVAFLRALGALGVLVAMATLIVALTALARLVWGAFTGLVVFLAFPVCRILVLWIHNVWVFWVTLKIGCKLFNPKLKHCQLCN